MTESWAGLRVMAKLQRYARSKTMSVINRESLPSVQVVQENLGNWAGTSARRSKTVGSGGRRARGRWSSQIDELEGSKTLSRARSCRFNSRCSTNSALSYQTPTTTPGDKYMNVHSAHGQPTIYISGQPKRPVGFPATLRFMYYCMVLGRVACQEKGLSPSRRRQRLLWLFSKPEPTSRCDLARRGRRCPYAALQFH